MAPLTLPRGALAGALVLAAVGLGRRRAPPDGGGAELSTRPRSVALCGDSYGVGLGPPLQELADGAGVAFVSHAVGGTSACQWALPSWIGPVLELRPDVVLASLGGNDFGRSDPEHVRASMLELARTIRAAGARLCWLEPPPSALDDPNHLRAAWWWIVGTDGFRPSSAPPLAADGIHSTPDGYRAWAAEIWAWLMG